ncbi:sigma-70 family RNA polymerase sigma factor [Candidatus Dojkabacteria bacterium]|nr:sigma-70 family RNA polymerase sigma factor [Candidatus Dojkabacteria bacterium]
MKIGFLIRNAKTGELVKVFTSKKVREYNPFVFNKKITNYIKALENHDKFATIIKEVRRKFDVPLQGFTVKDFGNDPQFQCLHSRYSYELENQIISSVKRKLRENNITLLEPINLDHNLFCIVIGNFLYLQKGAIYHVPTSKNSNMMFFSVLYQVTKSQFKKYLDNNWESISKSLKNLPVLPQWLITERDREIVHLRDEKKLKFTEIADKITKKYGKTLNDISINEDSVKAAYHRAKKKIKSLIK